jgi:hypothetical protein
VSERNGKQRTDNDEIPFALDSNGKPIITREWQEWNDRRYMGHALEEYSSDWHAALLERERVRDAGESIKCPCGSGWIIGYCHDCAYGRSFCPEHQPGQPACEHCNTLEKVAAEKEARQELREVILDILEEELPDAVFAILSTRRKSA